MNYPEEEYSEQQQLHDQLMAENQSLVARVGFATGRDVQREVSNPFFSFVWRDKFNSWPVLSYMS